ncbi:zinc ribbon domain-containing protein [bacterium]|nr:zinc ribbon domain-containing protein [bacterium]
MSAISAFVVFIILNIQNLFGFQNVTLLERPINNIQIVSEQNTDKEIDWLSEEPEKKQVSVPKNDLFPFFILFFILFVFIIGILIFGLIMVKKWANKKNSKFLFENLQTCPECNHKASAKAKYCEMCGSPLTIESIETSQDKKEEKDENK